ncbi:IS3 family transposase [Staphylococcus delphini]|uniref:IS3 family transposase n=1 Tax=Staphylococcus delphini TaxID=53344 RepID=UPI00115513A1
MLLNGVFLVLYHHQLEIELFGYINWCNNFRHHSSLQYLAPVAFKEEYMKIV